MVCHRWLEQMLGFVIPTSKDGILISGQDHSQEWHWVKSAIGLELLRVIDYAGMFEIEIGCREIYIINIIEQTL